MSLNIPQNEFRWPLNLKPIMRLVLFLMISSLAWHRDPDIARREGGENASRPQWRTLRLYSSDKSCHCLKWTSQCVTDCIFIWRLGRLCLTVKCPVMRSVTQSVCGSAVVIEGTAHVAKRGQWDGKSDLLSPLWSLCHVSLSHSSTNSARRWCRKSLMAV